MKGKLKKAKGNYFLWKSISFGHQRQHFCGNRSM